MMINILKKLRESSDLKYAQTTVFAHRNVASAINEHVHFYWIK